MPSTAVQSYLSRNLAALGERNAVVVELIASVAADHGVTFAGTSQGVPSAMLDGKQLCSRHRPLEEAQRQVDSIDLVEHAAVVVLGFGLGYHVQRLAERANKATLIIVFEPDPGLLRAALENIDHSGWMKDALLLFVTDASDRGALARKLEGTESILAQGVHFFEHPASRARLGDRASQFTTLFTEFISAAKTTLMTTLMRSIDTTRNLMLNIDHYVGGSGIADLHNVAAGRPAVVVSAGPSLHRNVHQLKDPAVRERCVIIAVQTTLKPLLESGIRPHFVTALDYHEISKRFYEGLRADDVRDVTLIADPKAHPVILDVYPGPVRCCANPFLDKMVGKLHRPMGDLPAGATVAHLAVYVAKFLGCNPIAMIGQDLGFTDGLYYSPGIAIHDVWAPELNPFNTIEMMEWQRIVRHRTHLRRVKDVHGKSIYTDAQMHTYLQQFERDFAQYKREGLTVIDATEGGVAKQHTTAMPLAAFLQTHASSSASLPAISIPNLKSDANRMRAAAARMAEVRGEVHQLKTLSSNTIGLLKAMIEKQNDLAEMARLFEKVDRNRKQVEQRMETFELLNHLNQLGVFNRMKADRRLHMQSDLSPLARQRSQLERDLANVTWIVDAAQEMLDQIELSDCLLRGKPAASRPQAIGSIQREHANTDAAKAAARARIAALVPIDPDCNGLGIPRSLSQQFSGRSILQATLEQLGESTRIESIILLVPAIFDVEPLIDRSRIGVPVEIEGVDGSLFGPERRAIAAARLWADTCWRGGIAGMSIYDEVLCPQAMNPVMQRRGLTAALIVGPDWPLVQVTGEEGCDSVIARHLEHPQQHNIVFTQAPPGVCGCLVSASLMQELAQRNRLSTIGGLLVYQPHAPQGDPIARDANVQIEHSVRRSLVRATFDSPRQHQLLGSLSEQTGQSSAAAIQRLEIAASRLREPQHITLELGTQRISNGRFRKQSRGCIDRPLLSIPLAKRIFSEIAAFESRDVALTLDGVGDPLLHPQFDEIIQLAKQSGVRGVHVRTDLLVDRATLDRLLACDVDVVSVNLNADRAATYIVMMGCDRFKDVLLNIEHLLNHRRRLTDHPGAAAFALPWIVPHLQRCSETYEDIDSFFDRWQHMLGCAVIEGCSHLNGDDDLSPAVTPQRVLDHRAKRDMMILSDGTIPLDWQDWACTRSAGDLSRQSIAEVWKSMQDATSKNAN